MVGEQDFTRVVPVVLLVAWAAVGGACAKSVQSLEIAPEEITLRAAGETAKLQVEARSRNGSKVEGTALSFTSRDPAIATVSSTGLVTAASHGSTTIVVQAPGTEAMRFVRVQVRLAKNLEIRPSSTTVYIGGVKQLKAEVMDYDSKIIPGQHLEWVSADETKARIDAQGKVTGIDEGEVTITARAGGLEGSVQVQVAWAPGQKALVESEKRATKRRAGSSRPAAETKKNWDPRLSMFD